MKPDAFAFIKSSLSFWNHLTEDQKEYLLDNSKVSTITKGQTLRDPGNECMGLLLIKSGVIRTYITSEEGREITLYRLESGDVCVLSASCVLQTIDFDVSIDTETDCELLQLSAAAFSKLSAENVYVELYSYKLATERFSDVMWAMQQILFTSFDKRLAAFLLEESRRSGSLQLTFTQEQIAKYLGSAREVVSRMLNYFSKEGLVELARGTITIRDCKRLRSLI
ncbi:Crp/Fnr family transcriptional regulator [Anaerosporobacter faecicola]|uniref:Crp/Fnr family transcriptional regulator n=1 Tax=Anaerosporobacter faecicola TaxID=2718714 RepID=UPI00143A1612|nr:Crp/Fnr family transcriptional regulator [Anaerosporobacter faecicola]